MSFSSCEIFVLCIPDTDTGYRYICIEELNDFQNRMLYAPGRDEFSTDCRVVNSRLRQSNTCLVQNSYLSYCLEEIQDLGCSGPTRCHFAFYLSWTRPTTRPCYNQVELECAKGEISKDLKKNRLF